MSEASFREMEVDIDIVEPATLCQPRVYRGGVIVLIAEKILASCSQKA